MRSRRSGIVLELFDPVIHSCDWDALVTGAPNGHFQFLRGYINYHADRFEDCSLVFWRNGRLLGVLPADRRGVEVRSHGGLSFGGLVCDRRTRQSETMDMLDAACAHYRAAGATLLRYKSMPAIYSEGLMQTDRYALFRAGGQLAAVEPAAAILPGGWRPNETRRRFMRRAEATGARVRTSDDWQGYWTLLTQRLNQRYGVDPVHSLAEICQLAARFPEEIRLHVAELDSTIRAGVVTYRWGPVDRCQYAATDAVAREAHLLDLVMRAAAQEAEAAGRWFDLGISTTEGGRQLNEGLMRYKESFGARPVSAETWIIPLG